MFWRIAASLQGFRLAHLLLLLAILVHGLEVKNIEKPRLPKVTKKLKRRVDRLPVPVILQGHVKLPGVVVKHKPKKTPSSEHEKNIWEKISRARKSKWDFKYSPGKYHIIISHLWERKLIFSTAFGWERVSFQEGSGWFWTASHYFPRRFAELLLF